MKRIIISILITSGLLTKLMGQNEAHDIVKGPVLCQGNYQTEQQAVEQLARMAAKYGNLKEWNARAARVRKQILVGSGLHPLPKRTPLNAVVHNKRTYEGYSVEAAAFEARPGFFVYGNLYRPT